MEAFNLLHITSWLSRRGGGIPPVIWALARESRRLGLAVEVAGLQDEFLSADALPAGVTLLAGHVAGPRGLGYSTGLRRLVGDRPRPGGIIHSHGLWMYPGLLARQRSEKSRCPLMLSPHGMLEPWALKRSRLKKRLAAHFFEGRNLHFAHCLHALCVPEAENFRRYGLRNPIAIIPNGVDLAEGDPMPDYDAVTQWVPEAKGKQRVLFLSRLHPKKGLPNLLRAWQRLAERFGGWFLLIAGPEEAGHEAELKLLASELGLARSVKFLGPVYGGEKRQLLAGADVFVLPSFSEGFSMAILEAAAAGLPVLLTDQCNFHELAAAGGAVEVSPDQAAVEAGLKRLLELSEAQRIDMGRRGMDLVSGSYTWPAIARQMLQVYEWLLGAGPVPGTVKLGEICR